MRTISLFSGCGGLDLGFHENGLELLYACDNDEAAVKCFNENISTIAVQRDVQSEEYLRDIDLLKDI